VHEDQKRHLSVVNASGFPFQLAVVAQVRAQRTAWRPMLEEHPWHHPDTHREGYIDLVLQHDRAPWHRIVVECKRQRGDSRWYFLDLRSSEGRFRYLVSSDKTPALGIKDGYLDPSSAEAAFCVLPGEDPSRRPTLERMCDDLLQSVEALALEHLTLGYASSLQFLPMIVTSARLFLCDFSHNAISLETGELPEHAVFTEVPYVRFRKTLWSSVVVSTDPSRIERVHQDRERSVLVLSSMALADFLHKADPDA
jgi:hypothetical protein